MNKKVFIIFLLFHLVHGLVFGAETADENGAVVAPQQVMEFSLSDCVEYASINKPDIRKSQIALERSEWQVISQQAKYAFNLSASSTQDLEDDTNSSSITLKKSFPSDIDVSASVSQNETGNEGTASIKISKVILGGGTFAESEKGIQDSIVDELVAKNNHAQKIRELHLSISRVYYRVVRSKQTLSIQLRQLERAKTNRERAVERDRLLDIANADLQVSENEDRVLQARLAIQAALDNLKSELGMPLATELKIKDEFTLKYEKTDLEADWVFAQSNHVVFLNYGLNLQKIERDLKIERSQLLPEVSLEYSVSQDSESNHDFDGDTESTIGLSLAWQIGSAADKSAYHRALLKKQEADIDYFDISQKKLLELRRLNRELEELTQRIKLAEERLKLQERSTALYADRWENGEIDILEFIRNQDALENDRVSLLRIKIEYIEKAAEYRFAIGR